MWEGTGDCTFFQAFPAVKCNNGIYYVYTSMNIQVGKWGNSLGIRIPGPVAKHFGLKDGSELDLSIGENSLVLKPAEKAKTKLVLDDLLRIMTPETLHGETDWAAPAGREEW
jgi:antitoxin MazE